MNNLSTSKNCVFKYYDIYCKWGIGNKISLQYPNVFKSEDDVQFWYYSKKQCT